METAKIGAGKHLTQVITKAYMDLHERAANGAFVVWIAINVPAEIFLGFENVVYGVPESHAAMNAAKGVGVTQCAKAEQLGYSMDLCSYARIDIGCVSDHGKDSPSFGLPKPDLIVSNNNNCSLLTKWFDVHHRQMGVPHFLIDVPFCYQPQKEKDREYIVRQFRDLIRVIEQMSGQKFNMDRFCQAVDHSIQGVAHWKKFLEFADRKPSGITAFDSFVHMAPFLIQRGVPAFEEHYRLLVEETEQRVANCVFPVPEEKYRLFWDNIAPWHQLRKMSSRLADLNANIVGATYTSCIGTKEGSFDLYPFDNTDPMHFLARTQNSYICPHGLELRKQAMAGVIRKLKIDGIIFASNRSCKPYSITQMDQQQYFFNQEGIPTVMIEVDHADARKYSEENSFLRIEALLEAIDAKRAA
ncbi:MAG: 2-hydroxyacyl-CoA dehydratase [Desulfobacterium sp.]|nr:2-hydroxyacyl-CoA dehydratase [Desulfobacterium sp.]